MRPEGQNLKERTLLATGNRYKFCTAGAGSGQGPSAWEIILLTEAVTKNPLKLKEEN